MTFLTKICPICKEEFCLRSIDSKTCGKKQCIKINMRLTSANLHIKNKEKYSKTGKIRYQRNKKAGKLKIKKSLGQRINESLKSFEDERKKDHMEGGGSNSQ